MALRQAYGGPVGLVGLCALICVLAGCKSAGDNVAARAQAGSVAALLELGHRYADEGYFNDAYAQFMRAANADPSSYEANFEASKATPSLCERPMLIPVRTRQTLRRARRALS